MYLTEFLQYLAQQKRYSVHTVTAYENDLSSFLSSADLNDDPAILEANHHLVRNWVVEMMSEGMERTSVRRKLSSVRSFYKWLMQRGLVSKNPASQVVPPKQEKKLPQVLSPDEVERLLAIPQSLADEDEWAYTGAIILEFFYGTGCRLSELINLNFGDLDLENGSVSITGKGNKQRHVPLTRQLQARLSEYKTRVSKHRCADRTAPVFITKSGKKLYPKLVYNLVNHYISLVSGIEKKSPHVLRHSFATHMLNQGAELNSIKELLGHSSLAATQVYTHNSIDQLKQMYNQAHPRGDHKN